MRVWDADNLSGKEMCKEEVGGTFFRTASAAPLLRRTRATLLLVARIQQKRCMYTSEPSRCISARVVLRYNSACIYPNHRCTSARVVLRYNQKGACVYLNRRVVQVLA
mgnify:CR=1 FL=1